VRALFPREVAVAVWEGASEPPRSPDEPSTLARAIPARVEEFRRGRACARAALAELGCSCSLIPVGPHREPLWPPGFVGAITHCRGLVAAAAGRTGGTLALGLDAEPARPLPEDVRRLVLHPLDLSSIPSAAPDTVVFSAKEAIFKALFPLTGTALDFMDVTVRFDARSGSFTARTVGAASAWTPALAALRGRWSVASGLVLTGCVVDAPAASPAYFGRRGERPGAVRADGLFCVEDVMRGIYDG
jgi:4'-phosphopantetheinyl transferase EntD